MCCLHPRMLCFVAMMHCCCCRVQWLCMFGDGHVLLRHVWAHHQLRMSAHVAGAGKRCLDASLSLSSSFFSPAPHSTIPGASRQFLSSELAHGLVYLFTRGCAVYGLQKESQPEHLLALPVRPVCALCVCVQSGEGPAACRAVRLHLNKALGFISDPSLLVVPSLALPALKPLDLSSK